VHSVQGLDDEAKFVIQAMAAVWTSAAEGGTWPRTQSSSTGVGFSYFSNHQSAHVKLLSPLTHFEVSRKLSRYTAPSKSGVLSGSSFRGYWKGRLMGWCRYMNAFDRAMNHLDKAFSFIASPHEYVSQKVGHSTPHQTLYASWNTENV
jgi:hypothetical protein